MSKLRLVGDVHGYTGNYLDMVKDVPLSLQVGDVGFRYDDLKTLDSDKHRIVAGNHDNYCEDENGKFYLQTPHFLGDYGVWEAPGFGPVFYVRGAWSIDQDVRTWGLDWWPKEELSIAELHDALALYTEVKPRLVVTHDCPSTVADILLAGKPRFATCRTSHGLEAMFRTHQPKWWIFGHYHVDWRQQIEGTTFVCLDELSVFDLDQGEL